MRPASGFIARYNRLVDRLADLGGALAGWALVLLCALVTAEIVGRNLFNRSTMIADEMSGYLNVAVVFLGLAYTMKQDGMVRVEVLHKHLRGLARAVADWYGVLASLIYASVLLYYVSAYTWVSYKRDLRSAEITETQLYLPQLFAVGGALLLTLYLLKFVLNRCRNVH